MVRWFCASSATQLVSSRPPGALASLMKISVITPYSGRFESLTRLSPYPDRSLRHLMPGTMEIRWWLAR